MSAILAHDAVRTNIDTLPPGQACGYTTGSGVVPWTAADFAAHPGAVRICQDPGATDTTADVLDVESGAATFSDCPGWAKAALSNYKSGKRSGQRSPAIYTSKSNITAVVNALVAGGVTSGVYLWVANWTGNASAAATYATSGSGPFPVIGQQFENNGPYDSSYFDSRWLYNTKTTYVPPSEVSKIMANLPELQNGANDQELNHWYVHRIQGIANAVFSAGLTVDGIFGDNTEAAVKAIQAQFEITQDGIVGPNTWSVLVAGTVS